MGKISGRMKVKTVKANFKDAFGGTLRIYKGEKFADDDDTIASISSNNELHGVLHGVIYGDEIVGAFEDMMKKWLGIKVQVATKDDSALVDKGLRLSKSGK
jgi:hypothetical protein